MKILDFGIAKVLEPGLAPAQRAAVGAMPKVVSERSMEETGPELEVDRGHLGMVHTEASRPSRSDSDATRVGGTPLFMAPEVWREEGADHASDVWSLGATLNHLATGEPPFLGRTAPELAFKILSSETPLPLKGRRQDLPESFVGLVTKALEKTARSASPTRENCCSHSNAWCVKSRGHASSKGARYPGRPGMGLDDRDRFFGREEDVLRCVFEWLRQEPLVVLVGPSGTGKSSLAAAGVAPRVAEGALGGKTTWRVVRVVPGVAPLAALAGVLVLMEQDPTILAQSLRGSIPMHWCESSVVSLPSVVSVCCFSWTNSKSS